MSAPPVGPAARILVVEDDEGVRRVTARLLREAGHQVVVAGDGQQALDALGRQAVDAVVTDISMPRIDGVDLLREVRRRDPDLPVILMTGLPSLETAMRAVEHGALRYLLKPVAHDELVGAAGEAVRLCRLARLKREAQRLLVPPGDRVGLAAAFDRALEGLRTFFQPIVDSRAASIFAYEALLRSSEPSFAGPQDLLAAGERLDRLLEIGRAVRRFVAGAATGAPTCAIFVNLHPLDLLDEDLYAPGAPLSGVAERVVLELTERASLDRIADLRDRLPRLRRLGYRLALDDLGAGYAGLSTLATLDPDIVKLDMSLVRGIDRDATRRKVVGSMAALCRDLGKQVVCEGVETAAERAALAEAGCDLMQGYLFARPAPGFPEVAWS